jgi:hypothetical protein
MVPEKHDKALGEFYKSVRYNKIRSAFLALLVAVVAVPTAWGGESPESTGVMETIEAFYGAIEADDVEARIALLADDVVLMPNHWTIMRGKEAVSESFRRGAGAVFKLRDREVVRLEISGNLAYTVNSYHYTYH